jgi:hypothetical protein
MHSLCDGIKQRQNRTEERMSVNEIIGWHQTAKLIIRGTWIERKGIFVDAKLWFQEGSAKPGQAYAYSKKHFHAEKSMDNNNYKIMLKYGQIGMLKLFVRVRSTGSLTGGNYCKN